MKKGGGVREEEKDLRYSSHDKAVDGHMSPLGINGVCLRKVNWWRNVLHLPSHCKKRQLKEGRKEEEEEEEKEKWREKKKKKREKKKKKKKKK